ncbi:MAG: hypothetical protein J7L66_05225 [Anaerolineaceae bacterium]|nr:hypothetical protein [Anaerolineaceae bacterium]
MHWLNRVSRPIILGHRGASKFAPENTMAAFKLAMEHGADGFELDTMLSKDGIPVVIHDSTVNRTTNGSGKVNRILFSDLQKLDAGKLFTKEFSGEIIPSLEEVLKQFKGKALINIELKNYSNPFNKLPEKVIEVVSKVNILNQLLFSSFLATDLFKIRKLVPGAKTALICANSFFGNILGSDVLSFISADFIHPQFNICTAQYIEKQHAIHRNVNAWTVNKEEDIKRLIRAGIDGIITNDPRSASIYRRRG